MYQLCTRSREVFTLLKSRHSRRPISQVPYPCKGNLAIINDLASYDKERREYDSGVSKDMTNIVNVVQTIMSLPDSRSAKAIAYAYQLHTESWMIEKLKGSRNQKDLGLEQWQCLEAAYICDADNEFLSMTSSRYGGEAARLQALTGCKGTTAMAKMRSLDTGEEERVIKLVRTQ